jgi:hypothetical protein
MATRKFNLPVMIAASLAFTPFSNILVTFWKDRKYPREAPKGFEIKVEPSPTKVHPYLHKAPSWEPKNLATNLPITAPPMSLKPAD